jgi:alkylation response protein AidB-like acyl-CoA dehydrogenase
MTPGPLSRLTPIPAAWDLPAGYLRHEPDPEDLRRGIDQVVGRTDWATLDWSPLVEALLHVGVTDIPLGRLVEGHVDALRILAQAGCEPRPDRQYGVWASRSAGTGLAAVAGPEGLRLNGTVRFASGAGVIDRALVPVWLDESTHLLVDLATDGLPVDRSQWRTSAMMVSQSHTVTVDDVAVSRSDVVGDENFYLQRPAFLPGGVGVAAVWAGGLVRVLDITVAMLDGRPVSPAQDTRLGRARLQLISALTTVRAAAGRLDQAATGRLDHTAEGRLEAAADRAEITAICAESRAVVATAVVAALSEVRALAGPAGLAFDPDLGHAIDDLGLYVAQLNLDAEATRLGGAARQGTAS